MIAARANAITIRLFPPMAAPTKTRRRVIKTIKPIVLTVFITRFNLHNIVIH